MEKWARSIDDMMSRQDWPQLSKQIYKANMTAIDEAIKNEFKEWVYGEFFASGMFLGQMWKIFLDNMPKESIQSVDFDVDLSAPSRFIEGWYQSLTGENRMNDIDECWNADEQEHLSIALH